MGCVGAKQTKNNQLDKAKPAQDPHPKDAASHVQAQKKHSAVQNQKPASEIRPSEPYVSGIKPPQSHAAAEAEHPSDKAALGIEEALNNLKSYGNQPGVHPNQSEIHSTNHRADVPNIEKRSLIVQGSPVEGSSQIEGHVQQMGSYIESGISRTQNEVKSTINNKIESALAHIPEEEEEKVNDEGVNNFAIPIRNINLNVEVKT